MQYVHDIGVSGTYPDSHACCQVDLYRTCHKTCQMLGYGRQTQSISFTTAHITLRTMSMQGEPQTS